MLPPLMPLVLRYGAALNIFRQRLPFHHPERWLHACKVPLSQNDSRPPLVYPADSSAGKHHDLASFLRYTERSGLDTASTTYVGTHFEYTVAASLCKYGFHLRRVGGACDNGI